MRRRPSTTRGSRRVTRAADRGLEELVSGDAVTGPRGLLDLVTGQRFIKQLAQCPLVRAAVASVTTCRRPLVSQSGHRRRVWWFSIQEYRNDTHRSSGQRHLRLVLAEYAITTVDGHTVPENSAHNRPTPWPNFPNTAARVAGYGRLADLLTETMNPQTEGD
jgi:hypothetical protein